MTTVRERAGTFDLFDLAMDPRADVAGESILPNDRHDMSRTVAPAVVNAPRRVGRHLGDASKQRMDHVRGPSHRSFRVKQNAVATHRPVDRVTPCGLAAIVGNEIIAGPKPGS